MYGQVKQSSAWFDGSKENGRPHQVARFPYHVPRGEPSRLLV